MVRKLMLVSVLFMLLLQGTGCSSITKQSFTPEEERVAHQLSQLMLESNHDSGFSGSVLVAKGDTVLLDAAYGWSDDHSTPLTKASVYPICSITKQFTATAILRLQESGNLNIADRISKYLPGFRHGDEITIRDLLDHSSGVTDLFSLPEYSQDALSRMTDFRLARIVDALAQTDLEFLPGSKFVYSNSGYILLTKIIEEASGMEYRPYLEKNIFKSAGMMNTSLDFLGDKRMFIVTGHYSIPGLEPEVANSLLKLAWGAGGLCSTTGDLFRFDRALVEGRLLDAESLSSMFTVQMGDYGYGWEISFDRERGKTVFHTGGSPGFMSLNSIDLDKDVTIILLMNENSNNDQTQMMALDNVLFEIVDSLHEGADR